MISKLWKARVLTVTTGFIVTTALFHQPATAAEAPFFNHFGTAFAITKNGYLLTNLHLLEGAVQIVTFNEQQGKSEAVVVATDQKNDLALLKIDAETIPLYIDTTTKAPKGTRVSTINFLENEQRRPPIKLSSSSVTSENGHAGDIRHLQIDGTVLSNDSGTPLLDSRGAVVGLVSSIPGDPAVPGQIVPDINYVLKAQYLKDIANKPKDTHLDLLKAPIRLANNKKELTDIANTSVYRLFAIDKEHLIEINTPYMKKKAAPIEAASFELASSSLAKGQENAAPRIVKIGLVVPLTGQRAGNGFANQRAAEFAIDHINSKNLIIGGQRIKFELQTEDDIVSEKQAIATAQRLVDAHVSAVVGYVNSSTTIDAASTYHEAGIPQISSYERNPYYTRRGSKTAFNLNGDRPTLTTLMTEQMMEALKPKRVSIIYEDTREGREVARAARITAEDNDVAIVAMHGINGKQIDFSAIVPVIKAAKPDLIYFAGTPKQTGPLLEQLSQQNIHAKLVTEHLNCSNDLAAESNNTLLDKQVYCYMPIGIDDDSLKTYEDFKKSYAARFGATGSDAPYIYDSVLLVAQAMVNAKSVYPGDIVNALKTYEFEGVVGKIGFDENGGIMRPGITVFTYVNKKMAGVNMYRQTKTLPASNND